MNRRALGLMVLALAAILGWWKWSTVRHPHYANYPPPAGRAWVAFGDSLTAGTGASEGRDYPSQLGQRLGVTILNQGVPGDTTADALARLPAVLARQPGVVLVCLGGNDSLQRIPLDQTLANLSTIIERLQAGGAFVVLIGIRSASAMDEFDKPFRRLARQHRALYVPNLLQGVLTHPSLMSDEVHPNDAGYALIAKRLEQALRPRLLSRQ